MMGSPMSTETRDLHNKRKKMWEASMANHRKYIDSASGLFADRFVENRPCPVCDVDSEIFLFAKEGGQYKKCTRCDIVYLNPVFKDKYLEEYYRANHDLQSEIVEEDSEFYIDLYEKGLRSIEKVVKPGNILDIGCSAGLFLDVCKMAGWNTYGVELNTKEAEYAKGKSHTVYNELIESVPFDTKFDAVTLWDVFEHLKNGAYYLKHISSLLADGGVIFMQIPSADSLAAKILQEKCNMFDGLEHVNIYSYRALEKLAGKCKLTVIDMDTVISEVGVINNYLNYESPYFGKADKTSCLLNLIDEEALHQHKLGYKMQVVLGRA